MSPASGPRPRGLGRVYRRGKTWWIEYWYRGRRFRESSKDRSEKGPRAVALLKKRLGECGRGRLVGPDVERTTFADLERGLVADYEARQNRSLPALGRRLAHLRASFERVPAVDIDYARLSSFIADRLQAKAARSTVLYELRLLHRAFVLALRAGKVAHVPPFPTVTVSNARKVFAAAGEVARIVENMPADMRPVVQILALTGWRAREILGLRWVDVDAAAGTIKLPAERSKNKRPRFFPYASLRPLAELIAERQGRTRDLERALSKVVPTVFWRSRNGAPIGYSAFREAWVKATTAARLSHLRPHDLRRTAARALVRSGVNERVVMKLLGWETPHMLQRYDIVATSDLVEGVGRLDAYLSTPSVGEPTQYRHNRAVGDDSGSGEESAEDDAAAQNGDGATPQNRTGDTVIFSHVLYQLS